MREQYKGDIERNMVNRIDQKAFRKEHRQELKGQGAATEQLVVDFLNMEIEGFKAQFSTAIEDKGIEIGGKEIDAVAYFEGKPAMALQITSQFQKGEIDRKQRHQGDYPFVRLDEMKREDLAIPRVTLLLDALDVSKFSKDPNFSKHPELALRILDRILLNLKFDLSKTQNPLEQEAVIKLIVVFEGTKKKYIH